MQDDRFEGQSDEELIPSDAPEDSGNANNGDAGDGDSCTLCRAASSLFDIVEILVVSLAAALVIFSCFLRLCVVDGNSMNNTLLHGEMVVTSNVLYAPKTGDIVVFHMTSGEGSVYDKAIIKRVIATGGQTVRIDYNTLEVSVDGVVLDEDDYAYYGRPYIQTPSYGYDSATRIFEATVPEGKLFVMGDNRCNSADSRFSAIGMVDERRVLGRVIFRVNPFTTY